MKVQTKEVTVGELSVSYDEIGSADDGERPFVLIHGLTGHRSDWASQGGFLARQGRCLAPD